ncbi:NAD(P)-binding protein [Canariomyces notabilis]|uniref:NAD(P)-binding protein n=1 Tax=Canariomyces notabilis TaxID=2074819 RepID=A0AAN6TEK6_9PEZI|nr:NAD(P)-binding protein [Canariomyces arenarius]
MAPRSRVWLITGCSSGFGLELAQVVVARGDRVLAASRNPDKVKELTNNDNLKLVRLDHNEPLPALKKAVNDLISVYGTIDVVVNNAAYVQTGTIEEATPEETLRQFQANFFGPLNLYRAVLPHLRSKGEGTLVTIGSMAAWYPMNSCNLYNASKAALRWATVGLADEIRGFGIKHCLVEPGFFRTSLLKPDANFAGTQASTRMPEYNEINAVADANFKKYNGLQLGNPAKGAEIIYEAVTSTGVAEGMPFPEFLPLGSDALTEITKAAHKTLDAIEEWRRISALSDFPEGK